MPTIFISYRRADSANITGRIYDRLTERYGRAHIFKDVDSIPPGATFPEYIAESIQASDVALVVIGPRWLNVSAGFAQRRLDDPADFVRVEIETALRLGVPVIPLLVDGASLPPARRLPASLRSLLRQNGLVVRQDPDFSRDMERVFAAIDYWQAQPRRPAPEPPTPTSPPARASAPVFSPASPAPASPAPGVAHRPAATAVAERIGIAKSRPRRLPTRLAPLLTLISALALIAVSLTLIFNGTAERILNPPNMPATQTASAQLATQQALERTVSATQTAQARLLTTPYTAMRGPGPCDTQDLPYSSQNQSYWSWQPRSDVTCASDTRTVNMVARSPNFWSTLTFWGYPTSPAFPATFTATVTITFTGGADTANPPCVDYSAAFPDTPLNESSPTFTLCGDGSWYVMSARQTPHYIPVSATYRLAMSVTPGGVSYSVNGQRLVGPLSTVGQLDSLTLEFYNSPSGTLAVTSFTLDPTT